MKNKRLFTFFTAIVMIFSVCTALPMKISVPLETNANEETAEYTEETYEQLGYMNFGDHIEITGCDSSATEVVIPAEIEGLPVTVIRSPDLLFERTSRFAFNENLTSVIIPDSVTNISNNAFFRCDNLTSIKIPNSVTSIGINAFDGTLWLEEKKKENPLVIVNNILVDGTTSSGDIVIPDNVISIVGYAFCNCINLTSITIPDSVTYIDSLAFAYCNLTSVNISEKNKYYSDIDGVVFNKDKTELIIYPAGKVSKEYIIPDNVIRIERQAFYKCGNLTSIKIPNSVTSIGKFAFEGTTWFETKKKENPLVIINNIIIDGTTCEGDIVIPNEVTSIAELAFDFCRNLTSITILNPECEIYDDNDTIANCYTYDDLNKTWKYFFAGTIYSYENSTAQAYAEKYGYKFESIGKAPQTDIAGDADCNGSVNIADAVVLQKFLLGSGNLTNWENVDLCKDGRIDVFDMIEMRKLIINSQSAQ